MLKFSVHLTSVITILLLSFVTYSKPVIYVNQIGFDTKSPKKAVIGVDDTLDAKATFTITDIVSGKAMFTSSVGKLQSIEEWMPGKLFPEPIFRLFKDRKL